MSNAELTPQPRRKRAHPARRARILTGLLSVAGTAGFSGYLAATGRAATTVVTSTAASTPAASSPAASAVATTTPVTAATTAPVAAAASTSSHGS
jgi:hypothetical protein